MAIDPTTGHMKPKILVVEDDGELLTMIKGMLTPIGEVTVATDGQEALDLMEQGLRPDLILTDVMMPRVDGLTLAKTVKKHPEYSKIPLLMLTAKSGPLDMVTGINAGARSYITKPFKSHELIDKVNQALKPKAS